MSLKAGLLLITVLVGSYALPASKQEKDMSIFFDHKQARIVGGTEASLVPYTVALSAGCNVRDLVCGASLITNRHVMTAAHCIRSLFNNGRLTRSLRGTFGSNRWNTGGTQYSFSRNITHPNYVPSDTKNDIGFLVTSTNVVLTKTIQPVSLNYDFVGAGVPAIVTGYGRITAGGAVAESLMQLSTSVIDGSRCIALMKTFVGMYHFPPVEPHIEICTFNSSGLGTCNGDSGSPLIRADRQQQIGVVSWGLPCAVGAPDVFTRISAYRNWIQQSIFIYIILRLPGFMVFKPMLNLP